MWAEVREIGTGRDKQLAHERDPVRRKDKDCTSSLDRGSAFAICISPRAALLRDIIALIF